MTVHVPHLTHAPDLNARRPRLRSLALPTQREQEAEIRRSPQGDRDGMLTWLRREKASLKVRIKAQEKQMELARAQPTQEPR